eukprot:727488-Hanusia_phi.AAC.2
MAEHCKSMRIADDFILVEQLICLPPPCALRQDDKVEHRTTDTETVTQTDTEERTLGHTKQASKQATFCHSQQTARFILLSPVRATTSSVPWANFETSSR